MKKKNFETRLANDLFPETPSSFEAGLKKTMQEAGIQTKKSLSATGLFTGIISVAAAAACLMIVLIGVLGGGKGKPNAAASLEPTVQVSQPTPGSAEWTGDTKVIALSSGFDFENAEKFQALYTGVLSCLRERGESEPGELWLCGIRSRSVAADTGKREDGYLSGYYVLAQHAFGESDGPELYCLSDNFEVLWCTEGSSAGPNHAVNPDGDSYAGTYQGHFLYGTEPRIPEPGVPHVTRGALVGAQPGTDIEFSMLAPINEVNECLTAAGSAHIGAAREYFLITVSAHDWDSVMENPILRFETLEGPVDVNMETELPLVNVVLASQPDPDVKLVQQAQQGVEQWLSQNMPIVRDFTDDWYGAEIVQQYAEAVRRALLVSGEQIKNELWICGVASDAEHTDGTPPSSAYVLALNVGDGEPSPELFYYENGRILWMTQGADTERINVVYHNGNTIAFGKSPAFDNRPLAMISGRLTLENGDDELVPVLPLDQIRQRITGGPYYYSARECYLWKDGERHEIKKLTITAEVNGKSKTFTLNKVNVLTPQPVPAVAVKSEGTVYPGRVTHMVYSLNEDGVAADGTPLEETMSNGLLFKTTYTWQRPLNIITASDAVMVGQVDVYLVNDGDSAMQATGQLDGAGLDLSEIDTLPPGTYYLCFHTTVLGPYSEKAGRYTYHTDFTIYKVKLL
jgi:outer membrane protein assembly factor BamB